MNQLLALIALQLVSGAQLSEVSNARKISKNQFRFSTNSGQVQVSLLGKDIVRVQAIPSSQPYTEPSVPIVVQKKFEHVKGHLKDNKDHYLVTGGNLKVKIAKNPLKVSLINSHDKIILEESQPINIDANSTVQTLKQFGNEQFYGGGMQNGRFSHRNQAINIERNFNWNDGGNPNPSPFYMSSKGYGVFRNTFKPGKYSFKSPAQTTHDENRFDAYYFNGPDFKKILNHFSKLTGRPLMPPMYGLEMGDSDCYYKTANGRPPKDTLIDSTKVAQGYVDNDLPVGWMLVNDGYGCEYTRLGETNQALLDRNITLGLWTESDLVNQPTEVGQWGVRVRKLDEKWINPGYEFAFKACMKAYNGIEDNSDGRGFSWIVEGWAGSQKCAVMWTGDQVGNWENIRFHIPTIHGSGLSSQAWVAGDVDGIWGGSSETYIRDLQFKVFTPVFMTMSGWAQYDKQPWRRGEPGTSINRKYLKLREQLLPYIYSYAHQAHTSGVPVARSMVLEYPEDPKTWDSETTKYQYMFGEYFLVAPVYTSTTVRNGIYLPKGKWYDYWTPAVHNGEQTLNNYQAPLDRIPLLIKAGAIIPMWPELNSFRQRKPNQALILDIYPDFEGKKTEFNL
ncbi:glycoside hydrolase family 31 protein [Conidiobolus coronatus NRRL 28638]|uniref:Glycoside hydrolase family 31 protein n=1 Tax=Conidiobolus coronatus (strain ATCC 28846 / CBS 209.66 / NRRL 28638) TaxID=796925 RepID=A0A137P3C1_CONC2|nr:glycoside hydrolase family 31 protein [Conidiobolus coronatus NRRL 28638]|eukprot:KXN69522.1 glycoside hydrolase family 31 protein [Conidiobolus coronatus NRRL 28638]